jgi:hypothetical protein
MRRLKAAKSSVTISAKSAIKTEANANRDKSVVREVMSALPVKNAAKETMNAITHAAQPLLIR